MKVTSLITLIYGFVIILFGIYWSTVNENFLSLIFGFAIGTILFVNAYSSYKNNFTGVYITLLLSIALTIVFAVRLSRTISLIPGGIMFLTSIITMGFSIYALALRKPKNMED